MPTIRLTVSEYNDESVARLKKVFPEGNPKKVDVTTYDWKQDAQAGEHLVLVYRLDPHLTDAQWRAVFERLHAAGVQHVLFIVANFLTIRYLLRERTNSFRGWRLGIRTSFAGHVRTR